MIWRAAYRTLVARDILLPELHPVERSAIPPFTVLLGGFDFSAQRELGVWIRLLGADAPEAEYLSVFLNASWTSQDVDTLSSIVPGSMQARTLLSIDGGDQWRELIQPDLPTRSFAAVVRDGRASIMMKGTPTEEAWDAFLEVLRA